MALAAEVGGALAAPRVERKLEPLRDEHATYQTLKRRRDERATHQSRMSACGVALVAPRLEV